MKLQRFILILLAFVLVSGCAPIYKFQKDEKDYKGYVAKRNEFLIPEYTVDDKKKAPDDLRVARSRFKRRKDTVEQYYANMSYIPQHSYITFPKLIGNMFLFIFRWPFVIVHEARYTMSDKYRERIDKMEEEKYQKEMARRKDLQEELNQYIQKDLEQEK